MIRQAGNTDELIKHLDDRPVMVSYIPVVLTPDLERLIQEWMQQNAYINQLSRSFNETQTIDEIGDLSGTPFEYKNGENGRIILRDEFIIQTKLGNEFNFNSAAIRQSMHLENDNTLSSLVLQAGDEFAVGPDTHQDENALTINFYLHGHGVQYHLDKAAKNLTFNTPCITAHRGLRHPLSIEDPSMAVEHNRPDDSSDRVNIILGIG